ncbi:MAG: CAP domain-containing protein [Planctomycetota bacterium]|nr:MAG: CAP domain-containing protein [Planctomycetota bacterium]
MEQELCDLINAERTSRGLEPLIHADDVRAVARAHSEVMQAEQDLFHSGVDGDVNSRLTNAGVPYEGIPGEDIAWGQGPTTVIGWWMGSPGHAAPILSAAYTDIGVGYATGHWWTANFIKRK